MQHTAILLVTQVCQVDGANFVNTIGKTNNMMIDVALPLVYSRYGQHNALNAKFGYFRPFLRNLIQMCVYVRTQ